MVAQDGKEIEEVEEMSNRRRRHIYLVQVSKVKREAKKQWSNPIVYKSALSEHCKVFGIPRYSGTRYRGERRWK